jgi:hypothetical protein
VAQASVGWESTGVRGTGSSAGGAVVVQRNAARRVANAAVAVAARGGGAAVVGRAGLSVVSSHAKLIGDFEGLLTSVSW